MGIIKIGETEEQLISRVELIKEKYKVRFEGVLRGLRLAKNQIPDSKDEAN